MFFKKKNQSLNNFWYDDIFSIDSPTPQKAIDYLSTLLFFENFKRISLADTHEGRVIQLNNFNIHYWNEQKMRIRSFNFKKQEEVWIVSPISSDDFLEMKK